MANSAGADVPGLSLREVCAVIPDLASQVEGDGPLISGASLNSRTVRSGDLYLALPGRVTHGARFAAAAIEAGAVAVVTDPEGAAMSRNMGVPVLQVEDPRAVAGLLAAAAYRWPARDLQLVGVTGTNGKTTVTAMVESGLREAGRLTGSIGTVGVRVGDLQVSGVRTTPEAPDLQATLARMRDARIQVVAMEVSSIAVVEGRVDGFRFDVVGFTQLTQEHLDYHGDMESYFQAKARLFTNAHAALGVVGIDDPFGVRLAQEASIPVYTWSIHDSSADWHAVDVRPTATGSDVVIAGPSGERVSLHVPLPGSYNVANALCAFGMLRVCGTPADAAARGIADVIVPGRTQVVGRHPDRAGGADVVGIVDYAHTPDAVGRVLEAVRAGAQGRVIAVLGAGGDRDAGKRPLMGEIAARWADVVVITDDNPRSEEPSAIRAAVRSGALRAARDDTDVIDQADRASAISVAVGMAEAGDTVIVLGKGHEQYQEVAGVRTPFDDAAILTAALTGRWGA